jgi:hypothetical protein
VSTGRFRPVLVPVGPRDEEDSGPQPQECFDRFDLRLGVVEEMRRREAQGPLGLRSEDIGAPASARAISGGSVIVTLPERWSTGAGIWPGTPSMRT